MSEKQYVKFFFEKKCEKKYTICIVFFAKKLYICRGFFLVSVHSLEITRSGIVYYSFFAYENNTFCYSKFFDSFFRGVCKNKQQRV